MILIVVCLLPAFSIAAFNSSKVLTLWISSIDSPESLVTFCSSVKESPPTIISFSGRPSPITSLSEFVSDGNEDSGPSVNKSAESE